MADQKLPWCIVILRRVVGLQYPLSALIHLHGFATSGRRYNYGAPNTI